MDKKQKECDVGLFEGFLKLMRDVKIFCGYYDQKAFKKRKFSVKTSQNTNKNLNEK